VKRYNSIFEVFNQCIISVLSTNIREKKLRVIERAMASQGKIELQTKIFERKPMLKIS